METAQINLGNIENTGKRLSDGITILLMLRGRITLESGNASTVLSKNDIAVINPGDIYSLNSRQANVLLILTLPKEYLERQCPESLKYTYLCCSASADPGKEPIYSSLKKSVANLAFLHYKKEPGCEIQFQSVLFEILYLLFQDFRKTPAPVPSVSGDGSLERLNRILSYIHQNYRYRIGLEEIAGREYLSVPYLSKFFRKNMGVSFLEYLNSLRLKSAVQDLVYSSDTITRVALNNGFASVKALNALFREQFGCTPQEYRKKSAALQSGEKMNLFQLDSEHSLKALVQFIDGYGQIQEENAHLALTLDLSSLRGGPMPCFDKIAVIGDIQYVLRSDTQNQLRILQSRLPFQFAYLTGFLSFCADRTGQNDTVLLYNLYEIFNLLREMNLVPILNLSLDELDACFSSPQNGILRLCRLLGILKRKYAPDYFNKWRLEVSGDWREIPALYPGISRELKARGLHIMPGLRAPRLSSPDGVHMLREFLTSAGEAGRSPCSIQFLTYGFDPNEEEAPSDFAAFEAFHRDFSKKTTQTLTELAAQCGFAGLPLYLTEWNTLTGKSTVEAGEFHRSALVADTLCSLMGAVAAIGFQLSLFYQPPASPDLVTYPLSLFLYRTVKRPLYYILKSITSLYPTVLRPGNGLLLSSDGLDHYALLMYHACYINPFQSLDNLRLQTRTQTVSLAFKNLSPGRYRIKKLLLDRDNGSLYHSWVRIDISVPLDEEDLDEYLENATTPSLSLYERQIQDTCTIRQELTLNAVVLYIIRKLD